MNRSRVLRVAITGAGGIVGTALMGQLPKGSSNFEVIGFTREDLDVTDAQCVEERLGDVLPDAVIHAAAYTQVDQCEEEPEYAREVNVVGTANVAAVCKNLGCHLIYLSTDYVFDGKSVQPYREGDPVSPLGVYGITKWEGELAVRDKGPGNALVVRTAWVYGHGGRNFVDAILEKGNLGEPLRVVADQKGSPTFSEDLADALKALLSIQAKGIVHVTGHGVCTWYEFAKEVLSAAGLEVGLLEETTSATLGRRAPRPSYSVLDDAIFRSLTGLMMRPWPEALKDYLAQRGMLLEV